LCIVTALARNSHQICVHEGDRDVILLCTSSLPVIDKVIEGLSFNLLKHAVGGKINILTLEMAAILFVMIPLAFVSFVITRL